MIVAFSGWREWTDALFIQCVIDKEWGQRLLFGPVSDDVVFRVGDARGADTIIAAHLKASGIEPTIYVADWERFGRRKAGAIRNRDMLLGLCDKDPRPNEHADLLVAFPEPGRSKPERADLDGGTWNAVKQAQWRGIEIRIPGYRPRDAARVETEDYVQLMIGATP